MLFSMGRPPIIPLTRDLIERAQHPRRAGRWYWITLAVLLIIAVALAALLLLP